MSRHLLRVLHAEGTKLRTAPATGWLPLAAAALTIAMSTAVTAAAEPGTTSCADGCDLARLSLAGVYLGQLAVVALAVLTITGEYQTGLLHATLAATPHRLTVFAAKATVMLAVVLAAGLIGVAGSLLAGRILLTANGFTFPLDHPPLLRAGFGTVLYLGLIALFSYGLAAAVRHTAPALTAILALLYLTPVLARFVTDERWHTTIERYAPMTAGLAIQATGETPPLAPWAGLAVLAAHTGATLTFGAILLIRRDAR